MSSPNVPTDPFANIEAAVAVTSWEQIEAFRERSKAGEKLSAEQYRAILQFFRASNTAAAGSAPKSKGSKASATDAALAALAELI
jgi:hypothetical protein